MEWIGSLLVNLCLQILRFNWKNNFQIFEDKLCGNCINITCTHLWPAIPSVNSLSSILVFPAFLQTSDRCMDAFDEGQPFVIDLPNSRALYIQGDTRKETTAWYAAIAKATTVSETCVCWCLIAYSHAKQLWISL